MVSTLDAKHHKAIEHLIKKEIAWFGDMPKEEPAEQHDERPKRQPARHAAKSERHAKTAPQPKPERAPKSEKPQRSHRPEPRHIPDAPDTGGFHSGNMPAFLARPVRSA